MTYPCRIEGYQLESLKIVPIQVLYMGLSRNRFTGVVHINVTFSLILTDPLKPIIPRLRTPGLEDVIHALKNPINIDSIFCSLFTISGIECVYILSDMIFRLGCQCCA